MGKGHEMKSKNVRYLKIAAVCSGLACLLQIIGLSRYVHRLPEDRLGIGLYIITIFVFAAVSVSFFIQSKKQKQ